MLRLFRRRKGRRRQAETPAPTVVADVISSKKQIIKSVGPVCNLAFQIHFRRLRAAKRRVMATGEEEDTTKPAATQPTTQRNTGPQNDLQALANAATQALAAEKEVGPNMTKFATDPVGNIRRLEAPRPMQDYFSISRRITWQSKLQSRLQVCCWFWIVVFVRQGGVVLCTGAPDSNARMRRFMKHKKS
jgi:hypothetical protein